MIDDQAPAQEMPPWLDLAGTGVTFSPLSAAEVARRYYQEREAFEARLFALEPKPTAERPQDEELAQAKEQKAKPRPPTDPGTSVSAMSVEASPEPAALPLPALDALDAVAE